jgi:hypothetical protein
MRISAYQYTEIFIPGSYYDQEEELKIEGKEIIVKPVWKWLLL